MIFDSLNKSKVCYAVGVSLNTFIIDSVPGNGKEYFILILRKDKTKLKGIRFNPSEYSEKILERELTHKEVEIFKKMMNQYNKILHCKEGRIYEVPNNSFKDYYVES